MSHQTVQLFATQIVTYMVPDHASLNADPRRVIKEHERTHPSTQHSNVGGWQSSWAIKLLAFARTLANQLTTDRHGQIGRGPYPEHFPILRWAASSSS